jgi:hypothetical protein
MFIMYNLLNDSASSLDYTVNIRLGRIWKERPWRNLRYYPDVCLEGLKITTQRVNQDSRSSSEI